MSDGWPHFLFLFLHLSTALVIGTPILGVASLSPAFLPSPFPVILSIVSVRETPYLLSVPRNDGLEANSRHDRTHMQHGNLEDLTTEATAVHE